MFDADCDGLHRSVRRLVALRGAPGSPVPNARLPDLPAGLPEDGIGADEALATAADIAVGRAVRLDHPGYLAHMDPPTAWPTWATAMLAAAVNQNLLHPDAAPTGRDLEGVVIDWLAPVFGMDGGHLVPGSTVANLTALWAAREIAGIDEVVTSTAAHLSVAKAAHLLDLGFRTVPVDDRQQLHVDQLGGLDRAALVLTAGTVAAGAIDPLDAGVTAAWRHVDAAWAGPLRLSDTHRDLLDGVRTADSVAVSAHKWLYQPKESAFVLFADTAAAHRAVSFGGDYLAAANVGLLGSHGATAALNLFTTILAVGRRGLAERVDADMATADRLCTLVAEHDDLQLRAPHTTGVVNWRPTGTDPHRVQRRLTDAWVSTATIDGQTWLRSVAANPNADPEHVVAAVRSAAARR